jgi:hypothetical protein
MSERNINIDDLFKDALKDFEVPSPLRAKSVKKDSFFKKNAVWFGAGVLVLSLSVASVLMLNSEEKAKEVVAPKAQSVAPVTQTPVVKEIIRDTVVKVVEVPKPVAAEAPKQKAKSESEKIVLPVYEENKGEKSMIITTRSSYYETYEVDEKGNKIKVLSTQTTRRSDTTLVK